MPAGLPPEAALAALDPHRNALMDKIKGAGGKRGLKSVPRREKKESDFMAILKSEMQKSEQTPVPKKTTKERPKSYPSAKPPTGVAALKSRTTKKQETSKQETKRTGPEIVKSSFCREPEVVLPPLGPVTTDAELDDLFNQIDAEIELDPEMSQDLLDLLNDEDEDMIEEETYEEPIGAVGYAGPLPDYIDEEPMQDNNFYYDDEIVAEKECSGDVEDDPEMAEMLKMIEDAKGDLEGAHEKDLAKLMDSFDEESTGKPGLKRKSVNQHLDQVVPKSQDEDAKKQRVIGVLSGIAIQPDAKEVAVSFDEDAIVDIIPSQTKDRAPPPKNRRPPSRSSRQQPGCDNNSDELPKQNGSDTLTLPSPTAELKKKKKLKKKAPSGGVAMFGGVDLFGGKNPFAGRKQDVSSSEEECAIEQQNSRTNGNKSDLKLPFGTADPNSQQSCDHVLTSKQKAENKAKEDALDKKRKEEEALEQKRKQEEQERLIAEEKKRKQEEKRKEAERKRLEEEEKLRQEAEEKKRKLEEAEKRKKEERAKKAAAEEKRRNDEAEKKRQEEEKLRLQVNQKNLDVS